MISFKLLTVVGWMSLLETVAEGVIGNGPAVSQWVARNLWRGQRLSLAFGQRGGRSSRAARDISFESRRLLIVTFLIPKMPILGLKTATSGTLILIFQYDSMARPLQATTKATSRLSTKRSFRQRRIALSQFHLETEKNTNPINPVNPV